MAQSYKNLKEDFVSNLSGGSVLEINWVTAVAPVGLTILEAISQGLTCFSTGGLLAMVRSPVSPRLL